MRRPTATSLCALALVPLLVGTTGGAAIAADPGDVSVTNTETVQARLNANGGLVKARVYEQLDLSGHGSATITNPVSTSGLRNLDGFGGYTVKNGAVVTTVDVDGERRLRSVSDYKEDLPLQVAVSYLFDGKPVEPGAVVGRTGELTVRYTVKNVTGKQQDVQYDDGSGAKATAKAETVVPMIGSLTTTLPSSFTEVRSDEAAMAGDGHGGTLMTFQMTLFPPIGSATAEFGYTAHVSKGVVPPATLTSLPVSPLDFPSYKAGSASYQSGANSGVDLTSGAVQIDSNLLLLRDGASELLAGLLQLRDGANQLSDGLNGEAAPGAAQLADGSRKLSSGLAEANAKAPQLIAGLTQVDGGLAMVDSGLAKMYTDIGGLPEAAKPLHAGIARLRDSIGSFDQSGAVVPGKTLLYGVDSLRATVKTSAAQAPGLAAAASAVDGGVANAIEQLSHVTSSDNDTALTEAKNALTGIKGYAPVVKAGTAQTSTDLTAALGVLIGVECGLSSKALQECRKDTPGLLEGLTATKKVDGFDGVDAGVDQLVGGVISKVQGGVGGATDTQASNTLRGGVHSLQGGVAQLNAGGKTLQSGLGQLGAGASQLDKGAHDLASGLKDAADGSTQLADGLATAADGAPGLVDGAQQLSDQGTSQLVESGEETAADYGVKYAVLQAGAERASTEGMAYGAPDGAVGATAYSIEIAGVDGEGVNATGRGLAAVALFALGAGIATVVRRRLV
ncbi:hypothetical protein Cch01nite_36390 [Cellulomonas chitinilytica]|uniref:X-X-X-Leu-X-X-Gly heptad repeat-containing protein n=1 Tax=Cellulomonas chitinilytica TaxID=398759 RepID=A0A919P568_9CELL|nr:hypothetical protein [Cellulomonas chitinilytica]GIG22915.1 hypothetical protein Cch01nite_36390 [Cellulomonas chitinilytica]